jgi:hypothetical protein
LNAHLLVVVLASNYASNLTLLPEVSISYSVSVSTEQVLMNMAIRSESRILKDAFSGVPVIWQWELNHRYQELGEALSEMLALEEGDEWKIDASVFAAASYVAAMLRDNYAIAAPRIFNNGPEAVVFNWSDEINNNLYLTISSDAVSALISTPQRIAKRTDFALTELSHLVLRQIPFFSRPYLMLPAMPVVSTSTDLPDFIGQ